MTASSWFLGSAIATALLTALVLVIARRRGWMDHPVDRSMHTRSTPSGGGLAIVIVVLAVLIATDQPVALIGAAIAVAITGFIDDLKSLPIAPRLLVQVLAVSSGLFAIGGLPQIALGNEVFMLLFPAQIVLGIACLWFLNLYNFMDGIDGLATSELAFVGLAAAWFADDPASIAGWLALAGAGVGFLVWNRPPAKIFMGDAGSGFLGLVVGLSLVHSVAREDFGVWTAIVLVAPFACDATLTLLRRMVRGEAWYRPHLSHAYQQLAKRWGSHGQVVGALWAVNLVLVLPAAAIADARPELAPFIAGAVLAIISGLVWKAGAGST